MKHTILKQVILTVKKLSWVSAMFIVGLLVVSAQSRAVDATSDSYSSLRIQIEDAVVSGVYHLLVPPNTINVDSDIYIKHDDVRMGVEIVPFLLWPGSSSKLPSQKGFIRVLRVKFLKPPVISTAYTLSWSEVSGSGVSSVKKRIVYKNQSVGVFSEAYGWSKSAMLLHPVDESSSAEKYLSTQRKHALFVTDKKLMREKKYPPQRASQWLYDRPQALYQLYVMSGNSLWKSLADNDSEFYLQYIDKDGFFSLKKRDVKYLNSRGVLFRFMFNGDADSLAAIKRMFLASLKWDPAYKMGRGFWTERNQAAVLNAALSYWELTNNTEALKRIKEIVDATYTMTFNPESNWPVLGCPQHAFRSHEGSGDASAVCSPWMMALLADGLWRYYRLTGDSKSADLIEAFGEFVLNHGVYFGKGHAQIVGKVIPRYLAAMDSPHLVEENQWSDIRHECDIAALLGKSVFIKYERNQSDVLLRQLFSVFADRCTKESNRVRDTPYSAIMPPRRFGWRYSTSSDLPWLIDELLE